MRSIRPLRGTVAWRDVLTESEVLSLPGLRPRAEGAHQAANLFVIHLRLLLQHMGEQISSQAVALRAGAETRAGLPAGRVLSLHDVTRSASERIDLRRARTVAAMPKAHCREAVRCAASAFAPIASLGPASLPLVRVHAAGLQGAREAGLARATRQGERQ
jgi:hypothetical protein